MTPILEQELLCYYQADELTWRDTAFTRLAADSAARLSCEAARRGVSVAAVIDELLALKQLRNADAFSELEEGTCVDWLDDRNWPVFAKQVDMIVDHLRRGDWVASQ